MTWESCSPGEGREEAGKRYLQALRLQPEFPDAHNNLGNVLRHQGNVDEAVASYREALRLRPAYPEAHNNLGHALAAQDRHDAAVACYQQAIRLRPDYAEAYCNLAGALMSLHRFDEAVAGYREAIRLRPEYSNAHDDLSIALVRQSPRPPTTPTPPGTTARSPSRSAACWPTIRTSRATPSPPRWSRTSPTGRWC